MRRLRFHPSAVVHDQSAKECQNSGGFLPQLLSVATGGEAADDYGRLRSSSRMSVNSRSTDFPKHIVAKPNATTINNTISALIAAISPMPYDGI